MYTKQPEVAKVEQSLSTNTDSIKYLGFIFTSSHKDDNDIIRQMRILYARSNRIVRLFHSCSSDVLLEVGRSFCGSFYCSHLWTSYKKSSFSKIRVAYNNFYRKLLHVQVAAVPVQCLWRITFLILNV